MKVAILTFLTFLGLTACSDIGFAQRNECNASTFGYFTAGHGETEVLSLSADRDVQFQILFVLNSGAMNEPAKITMISASGTTEKAIKSNMSFVVSASEASVETKQFPPLGSPVVSGCYRFL